MIYHGFAPQAFICGAKIIPIPKGSKASLTFSDKYRSIAINSVIGKILDHVIIYRLSDCLKTLIINLDLNQNLPQFCVVRW